MPRGVVSTLTVAALLAATAPAAAFSARFSWRGIPACAAVSPAFALKGVPRGTASLSLAMRDRDAPDARESGSTVPYAGRGAVPRGAVSYTGPCPPKGASHHYIWTIHALDAKGGDLDMTEAAGNYPK
ncbi:hypothetical protein D3273_21630 [Lichenibacterium minor]|uniref:YbhB/YbcL family Raf kinase inhibitor-like protein n=1 Tax=Lichenibacterium minor TaxID=2316528 RepID=A0A4Q2U4I1_9HYPH|nr:hypothetical protein [Lichenibacterium minor]RYC29881.1 hypothetical protein D3273_21630 [Lichenibacterium minor]